MPVHTVHTYSTLCYFKVREKRGKKEYCKHCMLKIFLLCWQNLQKQNVKNIQQAPRVCTQCAGPGFPFGIQHILPNNEHVHCSTLD